MKKIIHLVRLLLVSVLAVGLVASPVSAAVTNQSIAIPVYEYPTLPFWNSINAAGSQVPFVVVNPASGPGISADPNYTNQIATNTTNGQRSIGYVDTNYQTRSISTVISEIDQWKTLYPGTTGYFIDRVAVGSSAELFYVSYVYNYIKLHYPNDLVALNFGTYTSPDYEPYGDVFVNAEMDWSLYDSSWTVPADGFQDNPAYQNRFWHILHTTNSGDFAAALAKTRASNAGWVYITDDVLPNPYDATPSYWNTELTQVATLPASTIPNRGLTQLPNTDLILTHTENTTDTKTDQKNTYNSQFTVTNTSATYTAVTPTKISFTLPSGVSLASTSGANWNCAGNECTFSNDLTPGAASSVLSAAFDVGCSYTSGTIGVNYSIFAGNSTSSSITVDRPVCPAGSNSGSSASDSDDSQLAPTGQNAVIAGMTGAILIVGGIITIALRARRKAFARASSK